MVSLSHALGLLLARKRKDFSIGGPNKLRPCRYIMRFLPAPIGRRIVLLAKSPLLCPAVHGGLVQRRYHKTARSWPAGRPLPCGPIDVKQA